MEAGRTRAGSGAWSTRGASLSPLGCVWEALDSGVAGTWPLNSQAPGFHDPAKHCFLGCLAACGAAQGLGSGRVGKRIAAASWGWGALCHSCLLGHWGCGVGRRHIPCVRQSCRTKLDSGDQVGCGVEVMATHNGPPFFFACLCPPQLG